MVIFNSYVQLPAKKTSQVCMIPGFSSRSSRNWHSPNLKKVSRPWVIMTCDPSQPQKSSAGWVGCGLSVSYVKVQRELHIDMINIIAIILYIVLPYYALLHHITPYYTILHHILSYYTMLYHSIPYPVLCWNDFQLAVEGLNRKKWWSDVDIVQRP